ncbi:uncharacterized protein LOC144127802 isoform X1 [Amblyomma americanum]
MPLRYTEFLLFVQITAMLHLSAGPMAPADAIPATPVTVDVQVGSVEIGELWQPCYTMAPSYKSCASSTTSPFHLDKNRLEWPAPFSGRGDSVVMRLLHGMRFFMQVGNKESMFAKKSSNMCLLLFPRPGVLLIVLAQCFDVSRQLLLVSGDVELNPGPGAGSGAATRSKDSAVDISLQKQLNDMLTLLEGVNSRTAKMELEQSHLIASISEMKLNQESMIRNIADIDARLSAVESKSSASDAAHGELRILRELTDQLVNENNKLRLGQAELEDRQRRDNLLFFGVPDSLSETWDETEEKLLNLVSGCFDPVLTNDMFERTHRIGVFSDKKCRPIVVKFRSFKTKQQIPVQSTKLINKKVTVSEDYSLQTRVARKKLVQFAKDADFKYKLRYNKLYCNNKCYAFDPIRDSIFELAGPPGSLVAPYRTASASGSPHASP